MTSEEKDEVIQDLLPDLLDYDRQDHLRKNEIQCEAYQADPEFEAKLAWICYSPFQSYIALSWDTN